MSAAVEEGRLTASRDAPVGGQAVLEGVMMRSPHAWAISVRKPDGEITTYREPLEKISEKHKWLGWPVVRGVATLGQAMQGGKFMTVKRLRRDAHEPSETCWLHSAACLSS